MPASHDYGSRESKPLSSLRTLHAGLLPAVRLSASMARHWPSGITASARQQWVLAVIPAVPLAGMRLAPRTGGFRKLLLLGLGQAAEQLPGLGFELTDEREVTLGVPV
jgi:hypothetical protein